MELTYRKEQETTRWERMKDAVRQGFRKAGKAALTVGLAAMPLLAPHMTGCSGVARRPMDDAGPDSSITDASNDSSVDAEMNDSDVETDAEADADVPSCNVVERQVVVESEQELFPERSFVGTDCDDEDGLALEYEGHSFDVINVDNSSGTLGWNMNTIEVEITYPDGSVETGILYANGGEPIFLNDEISIWSPWGMNDRGRSCAQLQIYHEIPFTARLRTIVDQTVSEGDPSCEGIIDETLQSLEMQLPAEPWVVGPDETYTLHSLISSAIYYDPINLGIFGFGTILSRNQRDENGFDLSDSLSASMLNEGESHFVGHSGISHVTADQIYLPEGLPRASIHAHVTFYDDAGEVEHATNIGTYYTYMPVGGYIWMYGTSDGPEDLALVIMSARTSQTYMDSTVIERDGALWQVNVGANDEGVPRSSLTFTRIE